MSLTARSAGSNASSTSLTSSSSSAPSTSDLRVPTRVLMGPGPSIADPRVLKAMATPLVGHLDPVFLDIMNDVMDSLRYVFETENQLAFPMSGTGSAGMETCLVNLIEPGDSVVICINGVFGTRMADIAERCGAEVTTVEAPWGAPIDPDDVQAALAKGKVDLVAIVHAETSTGVLQPLEEISRIVHEHGALLVVDAVTSLAGVRVEVDRLGIDACYSGTQKCLSAPPGLSPVTFGPRAMERLNTRKQKVQSWYLDLTMISQYWGEERFYHHTAPISMMYALKEALNIVREEGLEAREARHRQVSQTFCDGLEELGLAPRVPEEYRAPMLVTVGVPEGVDEAAVRRRLLERNNIEIGAGLGELKGKVWRVGLMGASCHENNAILLLAALREALEEQGYRP